VPDPAPGPLRLVQSFANTVGAEAGADLLATREEAAAWLRGEALLPAEAGLSGSEHAALLRLRQALRDTLSAHTDGRQDPEAAGRLTRTLAEGRLVVTVDAASMVQLASAARSSYPSVVAGIAVAIAEAAAAGTWLRLKACSGPECGQAFYDNSAESGAQGCGTH
jgi:predicted RNA-binding Zn ribbon-like protein